MLSFCSNDPNIFAQQGDLQQGDEDNDQLLLGELDSGRPHGHCLGAFSQVDNILEFSATIFRGDILFTCGQYPQFSATFLDMLVSLVFTLVSHSAGCILELAYILGLQACFLTDSFSGIFTKFLIFVLLRLRG